MAITLNNRRSTSTGIKHDTSDGYTVTVNGARSSCTCGLEFYCVECSHRRMALAQEQRYAEAAKRRDEYCEINLIYA